MRACVYRPERMITRDDVLYALNRISCDYTIRWGTSDSAAAFTAMWCAALSLGAGNFTLIKRYGAFQKKKKKKKKTKERKRKKNKTKQKKNKKKQER